MKFRLGDIVTTNGLEGVVIAIFYHRIQVSFKGFGVWLLNKKGVELKERIEGKENEIQI